MPELPEIASRAREMQRELVGKTIARVHVVQPKCLNVPVEAFQSALEGATIRSVTHRGKWIVAETSQGWLLLNQGMGGELLLRRQGDMPAKWRLSFGFEDGSCLAVNFWWFGYAHYAPLGELDRHDMTRVLGPNALDVTQEALRDLIRGRRGRVKAFLLDQSNVAGIGNAYIHDILFLAGLHPLRTLDTLGDAEIGRLAQAIQDGLRPSVELGGAFYEADLYGQPGRFTGDRILIGYREGSPCPRCGTAIEKLKTGSTSSYLCPSCQPLSRES
jgi:formamidopyrimidine-DNA glycosylase